MSYEEYSKFMFNTSSTNKKSDKIDLDIYKQELLRDTDLSPQDRFDLYYDEYVKQKELNNINDAVEKIKKDIDI